MAFPETKWTMLAQATLSGDAAGRAALDELCRRYWPAVRDFLTGRGYPPEEAEDVTQEFFAGLLQSGGWHAADQARGKFRSFLLGALERTLIQRRRRAHAQKRGGGAVPARLDDGDFPEPGVEVDVRRFDSAWAERVLEMAMDTLERELSEQGRAEEFGALVPFLGVSADSDSSAEVAEALGVSSAALKSKIYRLRQRFRDTILAEISRTVETPHEAEEEMSWLFEILSQPGFDLRRETADAELPK